MMNLDEYKNMFKEIVEKMFVNCIVEKKERDWDTKTDYKSYKIQLNQDLKTMLDENDKYLEISDVVSSKQFISAIQDVYFDEINNKEYMSDAWSGYKTTYKCFIELEENLEQVRQILESKLVNKNEKGEFIDRFRKRLMFPIQDERGRFIAFGGRILIDPPKADASEEEKLAFKKQAKYINSTENIAYSKGRHLFGLYAAKKAAHTPTLKKVLIVEGYMDTISLHQRGITNVVASLGTALTEAQGRLLRKSSEQVIVGYDADGAGQAATLRGLEILQNLGCDVRILQIEGAKDPDEFILKYGPERLQKYIDNAISLVEFKIKNLKKIYHTKKKEILAVENFSFELKEGENIYTYHEEDESLGEIRSLYLAKKKEQKLLLNN